MFLPPVLDGTALPHLGDAQFGALLNSTQLLLKVQMAAVAKEKKKHLCRDSSCMPVMLSQPGSLSDGHAWPGHLTMGLLQCALYGLPSKTIWKLQLFITRCSGTSSNGYFYVHVSLLLYELHWLPVGFQVQFKMLVVTDKVIYGIGPGYERDHVFPIVSTYPGTCGQSGCPPNPLY